MTARKSFAWGCATILLGCLLQIANSSWTMIPAPLASSTRGGESGTASVEEVNCNKMNENPPSYVIDCEGLDETVACLYCDAPTPNATGHRPSGVYSSPGYVPNPNLAPVDCGKLYHSECDDQSGKCLGGRSLGSCLSIQEYWKPQQGIDPPPTPTPGDPPGVNP